MDKSSKASSSDKPKLPKRTVSDSSLEPPQKQQQPQNLLGRSTREEQEDDDEIDPDENDYDPLVAGTTTTTTTKKTLKQKFRKNNRNAAKNRGGGGMSIAESVESRGLSLLEGKTGLRGNNKTTTTTAPEDSRGLSLLMEASKVLGNNNNKNNDSGKSNPRSPDSSDNRDRAVRPPTRERSNRGKRSTSTTGSDKRNNSSTNSNKGSKSSLLGKSSQDSDDDDEGGEGDNNNQGSWQQQSINHGSKDSLSKGKEKNRRGKDIPAKRSLQKNNASVPTRKGSLYDSNNHYDEDKSDVDASSKRKSLCGLLPQTKKAITSESSVAGSSLPGLTPMDASMSSFVSRDESVVSYLSHKKSGLIVASNVQEGPMKHFLGNLTSSIERKHASIMMGDSSIGSRSIDITQLMKEPEVAAGNTTKAAAATEKSGKKKPTLEESLNSSFMASGVNSLSGSALKFEADTASLPSLMSYGPKGAGSVAPQLETQYEQPDEDEMSLPSLMSYGPKGSGGSVAPPRKAQLPLQQQLPSQSDKQQDNDMDMSLPSLMSFGPKDDVSCSMPSLDSFRTAGTNATNEASMHDDSMPSLASMKDDPSVASVPALKPARGGAPKGNNKRSMPGNPLNNIQDDEDEEEESEEEEEEEYDEGDYGEPYEESMTELDESDLEEDSKKYHGVASGKEEEDFGEESETLEPFEDDDDYSEESPDAEREEEDGDDDDDEEEEEEDEEYSEEEEEGCDHDEGEEGPSPVAATGSKHQKGQGSSAKKKGQQPQEHVQQFVVKPKKKKKKSKAEKEEKDAKEEQVQMWQEQFQQEQLLQQQQLLWQQQQQLLAQHQMLQQQQMWMNNGMNMNVMQQYGGVNAPNPMMNMNGQMDPMASMNMSGHDPLGGSSVHSEQSGRSRADSKTRKSMLKKSQSLDYDFSFLDNPDMPEVSEASAEDVLQPMNPSFNEDQPAADSSSATAPGRGKKKENQKKPPPMSFTSRFKKSVKKIKSGFAGGGSKQKLKLDTGLNDKQFFPDDFDDSDEESTMKGLLSG